ncbi:MAG: M50 family metallopeptidase [Rickettsiales bacterium]|nr:M50 family metallopeptidase [Rickettsiales bacterium]
MENKEAKPLNFSKAVFAGVVFAAFIVSFIPFVGIPFLWMMTFFHEISHGLAALVTGGSVKRIELNLDGSGLCVYAGGIRFIVAIAGYLGAVLCGMAIYMSASSMDKKRADHIAIFLTVLVVVSAVLWARDLVTWIIMIIMSVVLISVVKLKNSVIDQFLMKFIGIYVLLDAVRAPLHLLDGRSIGDGADLAEITFIPEIVWVIFWLSCGLYGLYFLWKKYH